MSHMMRPGLFLIILVIGCQAQVRSGPTPWAEIIEIYPQWHLLTPEPLPFDERTASLCRIVIPGIDRSHWGMVNFYVNDAGYEAMRQQTTVSFPVGTIIVKEDLSYGDPPPGLGMMIKREKGFHPEAGDWEFLYWAGSEENLQQGIEETYECQECHRSELADDFVFRTYLDQERSYGE